MEIGLVTAFLGGALAILSPCGALLLPAFFASTVGSGARLLLHGGVFYAGLLLVLVPLGVGAGAVGTLFATHRTTIITIASVIMIGFGLLQILGLGFDPGRMLPGGQALQHRVAASVGWTKTFLLGAASGVAGFCAGPILGAVLTLAAAQGNLLAAGVLLAVYGAGMIVPLLVIAAAWNKLGDRARRALRGRAFTLFGREFHTTAVATAALILAAGVLFWTTNGLIGVPEVLPTQVSAWLQGQSSVLANGWIDIVAILLVSGTVIALWWRTSQRKATEPNDTSPADRTD